MNEDNPKTGIEKVHHPVPLPEASREVACHPQPSRRPAFNYNDQVTPGIFRMMPYAPSGKENATRVLLRLGEADKSTPCCDQPHWNDYQLHAPRAPPQLCSKVMKEHQNFGEPAHFPMNCSCDIDGASAVPLNFDDDEKLAMSASFKSAVVQEDLDHSSGGSYYQTTGRYYAWRGRFPISLDNFSV